MALYSMSAAIANSGHLDIQAEALEITRRQIQEWFQWMDSILDIHRSNFVFREATPAELEQHKTAVKLSIRTCLMIQHLIADPDFNEPDLVHRLQVRIQQLRDAYNTFHDPELSDEEAERVLKQVFPE
jgi:hypothetical protein